MAKTTLSEETVEQLKQLYPVTNTRALARQFGITYEILHGMASRRKWAKAAGYRFEGPERFWTAEREAFLKENYAHLTADQIAEKLGCARFVVKNKCHKLHLAKGNNTGQFKKGIVPPNKGKKQSDYMSPEKIARCATTRFKAGQLPHNTKYDGHERLSKDGYIEIRVSLGKYKMKHRWLWEQQNGPIPKGHCLIFIDGNKQNICHENLQIISFKENAARTRQTDGYIAARMAAIPGGRGKIDEERREEYLKHPDLIELKRLQLQLNSTLNGSNS